KIGLEGNARRALQHVHTPPPQPVAVAAKQSHHRQANGAGAVRGPRSKHAVRPRIARWRTHQFITLAPIENPKNVEMRKPLDVFQASFEFGKDFEPALFLMLRSQPARDLVSF